MTVAASESPILIASGVRKTFRMGDSDIQVLKKVDLTVAPGEFIAIEGRSGSGKSTLLHILGALDECTGGAVMFDGRDIAKLSSADRAILRNTQFGFVFQFYHLLPELNVLENTMLSPMIGNSVGQFRAKKTEIISRARELLAQMGLEHRLRHRPRHLSGGERQRVAIARALMNSPKVLLADEPTGNLDEETRDEIIGLLETMWRERGLTMVFVTHDSTVARRAQRIGVMKNGRLTIKKTASSRAARPQAASTAPAPQVTAPQSADLDPSDPSPVGFDADADPAIAAD
jgi:ABC-type lipoprotein export system ATPase subunit